MVCLTLRVLTRKVNFFKLRGGNHTSRPVVIETTHSKFCFQVLRNSDGDCGWSRPNREVKNPMIVTATHFQPQSFLIFTIGSVFSWIGPGSSRASFLKSRAESLITEGVRSFLGNFPEKFSLIYVAIDATKDR